MMRKSFLLVLTALSAFAAQPDMDNALRQLEANDPQKAKPAVEFLLKNSERAPSVQLFLAAAAAQGLGRVQDAAFLFYTAQLRARMDLVRYPPKGKGGDSPTVAIGAINQTIGGAVNPAIMREPKAFRAVVERIATWTPVTPKGYDPGWAFEKAAPEAAAKKQFDENRASFLKTFRGMATLLNDPEYFAAFKVMQDYNFASYEEMQKPQRIKQRDAAEKTMRAIEQRMGIQGLF